MQERRDDSAHERRPLKHPRVPLLLEHEVGLQLDKRRILLEQELVEADQRIRFLN